MKTISDIAKQLGSLGGKKSAESRLGDKTKEERSELMRKLALSKHAKRKIKIVSEAFRESLAKNQEGQY